MTEPPPGDLTDDEQRLRRTLPRPPPLQDVATTGVWIAEWRAEHGPRPGTALHRWLEPRHPGWSRLVACQGRTDVVSAIKAATWFARDGKASPVLHLEADCDAEGLIGPGRDGAAERIGWHELAPHLARLNLATRCNLVLVCTAGAGVAAQLAAATGQRVPCVAVIAPASAIAPAPAQWLISIQRLYRCWQAGQPGLEEASVSLAPMRLEATSMPACVYRHLIAHLLLATRADRQTSDPRGAATAIAPLRGAVPETLPDLQARWQALPRQLQRHWRSLFMADLYPANLVRFDFDARTAAWRILQARGLA
ncbi:hypothetical protein [Luteimonas kalidii]|uniref:Uncharacterized protein n=1 Tax=Luteimonas kalidii TaxID=3042025 RepID=A0ABT6JRP7_9GAMM|nr:hypothetical protein [Luteimonas kalidii]MDH5833267.1 hypothetical protein [Luteimonas kalidii]